MQLRLQFETVDGLVDEVVATYHNGFNKAIHNYSQILQLFAEAKAQVRASATAHPSSCGATGRDALWGTHTDRASGATPP